MTPKLNKEFTIFRLKTLKKVMDDPKNDYLCDNADFAQGYEMAREHMCGFVSSELESIIEGMEKNP